MQTFCSNFAELGIDFFEGWNVVYRDFKLTRKDWPKLVNIARKVSVRLRLEKRWVENYGVLMSLTRRQGRRQ
jgi:hypothetical protein